jgi:DNA topoisomerase II
VKDYNDMSTNVLVDMTVTFHKGMLKKLQAMKGDYECGGLEKTMKLYTTNTNTNMHLFDAEDHLKKYECVEDIIADHYAKRWKMYEERKAYMLKILQEQLSLLSNKAKYIMELLDNTIDLRRKKKDEIENMLKEKGYNQVKDSFHYLIKMPMDAVSEENVEKIVKEKEEKEEALAKLKKQTIKQMWKLDLERLEEML